MTKPKRKPAPKVARKDLPPVYPPGLEKQVIPGCPVRSRFEPPEHFRGEFSREWRELRGEEGGRVVIRFPKPVAWIGFTGDQAMDIAQTLIKHARLVGVTAPLVLRVGEA